jgi:hypothetical protein
MERLVEEYLRRLTEIRGTGAATDETSYYSALENLLNEIGKALKPRVVCNGQLRNEGAGHPDFGLYAHTQCNSKGVPKAGQATSPERGVIEVKPVKDSAWQTAKSDQVSKYWNHYRLVLVANYRDFILLGEDDEGNPVKLESYNLAKTDTEFWKLAASPRATAKAQGVQFGEFLRRVLIQTAPIRSPQELAWLLASYGRDALARVEAARLPALDTLRSALEDALGIKFEGEKGEHLFRSTLVQTLFYGVFSAWVLSTRKLPLGSASKFDWKTAAYSLHVPMVRNLYDQIATPTRLGPLGLTNVLDLTGSALNRVDRVAFFTAFDAGKVVQYFYEPFLEAFDPQLRKELGVWYTPPEVVHYMVSRVDTVLRTELGIADGLADECVYVLDPACGTGSYLVAVIERIAATLKAGGAGALLGQDVKKAAMERVFGFEIMPAPYVIAHWQIGLLLDTLGASLSTAPAASGAKSERAAVYLTNALTGWTPPTGPKAKLLFPELEEERDAAEHVKRDVKILVILGNPPYNAFAGTSPTEEAELVEPYKVGLSKKWGIRKYNLDDFYVRFLRVAERRIAEQSDRGIICYVSNYSYLSDPSFVVVRERLLAEFDAFWIDCMNGDSRETGKVTPDGKPDPSVFSTEFNREGIRLGTAIGLLVRKEKRAASPTVRYRDFWGATKRQDLIDSLSAPHFEAAYKLAAPTATNRYSFRPEKVSAAYASWPRVVDLCSAEPISGLQEMRRGALMSIDRVHLEERMQRYFDPGISWTTLKTLDGGPTHDGGRFDAAKTRAKLLKAEKYAADNIRRYALLPFDVRWSYYSPTRPLWNEPRPALVEHSVDKNQFFIARMAAERPSENAPVTMTVALPDYHLLRPNAVAIPLRVQTSGSTAGVLLATLPNGTKANLSANVRAYLSDLGLPDPDKDKDMGSAVWMHALAICFSPTYLTENFDGVQRNWPRIPLPKHRDTLLGSVALGKRIAALLDTETPVAGITAAPFDSLHQVFGAIARVGGGSLKAAELELTAGWGAAGAKGIVMPGQGHVVEREAYEPAEHTAMSDALKKSGANAADVLARLGPPLDVYLNDVAFWKSVPTSVWEYRIGGYQVVKKWLSYREGAILGRPLTSAEVKEVSGMIRRIAALIVMQPSLDANYKAVVAKS